MRNHFVQNLDFDILSKNFSWLSNSVLTIPAKLNGQLVVKIIDTGSSAVIVLQNCETFLTSRKMGGLLIHSL